MCEELPHQEVEFDKNNRIAAGTAIIVIAYIVAIAGAEAVGVFIGIIYGTLCHALLIPILLSHYALKDEVPYQPVLPVFALASLLRILSVTIPIKQIPQIYWYAMVGIPLLVAVALAIRLLDFSWVRLGLRLSSWPSQILISLSGFPLSIAAFLILRPEPLTASLNWRDVAIGSLILFIFTGFTEEIMFRGLLQQVANEIFGRTGVFYCSTLFAIMYIGSLSLSYTLFIGLIGLYFGWCVNQTSTLWGVILAHSILNIGLLLIWPFLWS